MPIDLGPEPVLFVDLMKGAHVHPAGSDELVQIAREVVNRNCVSVIGFLRHFSNELCQKKARNWSKNLMPKLSQDVSVIVVSNGTVQESAEFVQRFQWPAINLFTDPDLNTYRALNFAQGFTAAVNTDGVFSTMKSVIKGGIRANPFQLGGVVIVDEQGYVRYFHREAYSGDHADLDELFAATRMAETIPCVRKN